MTDEQENRLSMYLTLQKFFNDNASVWYTIVAYVTGKNSFDTKILSIQSIIAPQSQNNTGVAQDKAAKKAILIPLALNVSSALQSYAALNSNNTLFQQMKFTKSSLESLKDTELTAKTQFIHSTASGLPANISDVGVTPAVLLTLQGAINDYSGTVPTPTSAKNAKAVLTKNLKKLFTEAEVIRKKVLNKLTVQFQTSNPDFFSGYNEASKIIDLGKTTTKLRGTVKDNSADKNPIVGAIIKLLTTTFQAVTNEDGKYSITKITPGDY